MFAFRFHVQIVRYEILCEQPVRLTAKVFRRVWLMFSRKNNGIDVSDESPAAQVPDVSLFGPTAAVITGYIGSVRPE